MNESNQEEYSLLGHRVTPLDRKTISRYIDNLLGKDVLNIDVTLPPEKIISNIIDTLSDKFSITIPIEENHTWNFLTAGIADTETMTAYIPESIYEGVCKEDYDSIHTVLHEIGHLLLFHKPVLHDEKSAKPTKEEDAEWQANTFADIFMEKVFSWKLKGYQYSIDFYWTTDY